MGIILITLCISVYVLACMEWSNNDPLDYEVKVVANRDSLLQSETIRPTGQRAAIGVSQRRGIHYRYMSLSESNGYHSRFSVEPQAMEHSTASIE